MEHRIRLETEEEYEAPVPGREKTLVLGIGNALLGDEGAGVHAVRALSRRVRDFPGVEFLDGGTLSFTLAPAIERAGRLIVIDAAQLHAPPGSVEVFEGEDMDRFLGRQRRSSVHEVSLTDLLAVARLSGALPERRTLIGIQPAYLDWADAPTPAVAQGIARACEIAIALLKHWPQARRGAGPAARARDAQDGAQAADCPKQEGAQTQRRRRG
ncbi:MAG TPA: HyaD/HybD family hydrogenase maturation endopeptidase [Burkholderiales bacterium]|nr:HyaD/HybD family hydrogenase maturation endopeptidase [Burkholderiales bacterium]